MGVTVVYDNDGSMICMKRRMRIQGAVWGRGRQSRQFFVDERGAGGLVAVIVKLIGGGGLG